jgi:hypothetical protein
MFKDLNDREIQLSPERLQHIETHHPEMINQITRIKETLLDPIRIIQSRSDSTVELYYHLYQDTPVTEKYLCVVVKVLKEKLFIITVYFTDTIKKGEVLWKKK